jgi:hypothetical protein
MAAIADIQITPPVLKLDPATRAGRFSATVANQLGRDGRLEVSLIPVGDTKEEWLRLEERYKTLSLKKDETAMFDVMVSVPSGVAPGTYGFRLRCADALDPGNVKVDSEQRDLVVAPRAAAPPPAHPSGLKWVLIAAGALIVIGGGIALALALTRKCDPVCKEGFACHGGTCEPESPPAVDAATTHQVDASHHHPDASCAEGAGRPCGQCNGTLRCDGTCSKPTPDKLGQKCNECGGTVQCNGCAPAAPANFGASCDQCGGIIGCSGCLRKAPANFGASCNECGGHVQCNGGCAPAQPADLHQVKQKFRITISGLGQQSVGGPCDTGFEIADVTVRSSNGLMQCQVAGHGAKKNCTASIAAGGFPVGGGCEVVITERRVCDQAGLTEIRDHRDVPRVSP